MTYIGLARKWRPQKFSELVGQAPIARTLENAIRLGRVSHALLLTGSRGVGKTTTARILAKGLNCEKGPTTEPCGECSNCREITAGTNVDVLEVDGASNTKVDEIRDLLENVQYRPNKSRYKIYIIDEVHMLSTHSFNALLKTLEEPPSGVMFIFATTEPHKIPDTIHSRCQRFDFRQISEEQIAQHLGKIVATEKIKISPASLELIARQAAGGLRDALSLLDQVVAFSGGEIQDEEVTSILGLTDRQLISKTIEAFAAYDVNGAVEAVSEVFSKGFDPKSFLIEILNRVRDLLVLRIGASTELVRATTEECQALKKTANLLSPTELERWFDILRYTVTEVSRSEFPRYLMEVSFMRVTRKPLEAPLTSMISRLESLEAKLSSGVTISRTLPADRPAPNATSAAAISAPVPTSFASAALPSPSGPKWESLVQAIKKKKPSLAAILLQATKADITDSEVLLGYDEGSFYATRAKETEFQSIVCELAKDLFGRPYGMKVQAFTRLTSSQGIPGVTEKVRQKEALENPVIQKAVSLFDARVEEVKPAKS